MKSGTASVRVLSGNNSTKKLNRNNYTAPPVTETLTNGFFTVNRQWKVQYWNKAAEKLLGVAAADIVEKNLWQQFADLLPLEFYTVYHTAFLQTTLYILRSTGGKWAHGLM
jgi:PAS domain-containing protein